MKCFEALPISASQRTGFHIEDQVHLLLLYSKFVHGFLLFFLVGLLQQSLRYLQALSQLLLLLHTPTLSSHDCHAPSPPTHLAQVLALLLQILPVLLRVYNLGLQLEGKMGAHIKPPGKLARQTDRPGHERGTQGGPSQGRPCKGNHRTCKYTHTG